MALLALGSLSLEGKQRAAGYADADLDELRLEIDDLKQALHVARVDFSLLEEKTRRQEWALSQQSKNTEVSALDKRISSLEKTLEKITSDLRTINTAVSQASGQLQEFHTHLSSQDERLNEVGKLKGTLASIAKAVSDRPTADGGKTYKVKAGDSLEKIAKTHQMSVKVLRELNHLTLDKILVGQELKVSHE